MGGSGPGAGHDIRVGERQWKTISFSERANHSEHMKKTMLRKTLNKINHCNIDSLEMKLSFETNSEVKINIFREVKEIKL